MCKKILLRMLKGFVRGCLQNKFVRMLKGVARVCMQDNFLRMLKGLVHVCVQNNFVCMLKGFVRVWKLYISTLYEKKSKMLFARNQQDD